MSEHKNPITLHGLGFLQAVLKDGSRLHVWHPDLPRRNCADFTAVHSHRFSFESTVVSGTQENWLYGVTGDDVEGERYRFYSHKGARGPHGNRPWIKSGDRYLTKVNEQIIPAGQSYVMSAGQFHQTRSSYHKVATLMRKTLIGTQSAYSTMNSNGITAGVVPDDKFDRNQLSQEAMTDFMRDVLGESFASYYLQIENLGPQS